MEYFTRVERKGGLVEESTPHAGVRYGLCAQPQVWMATAWKAQGEGVRVSRAGAASWTF